MHIHQNEVATSPAEGKVSTVLLGKKEEELH
jgi:hypothetical protein